MWAASLAAASSWRRSNSLSLSMRVSYRTARPGQTGASLAAAMARGLLPRPSAVERAAIARAKARLDRLDLYPRPVDVARVRVLHAPWLFALPGFRRFVGYEAGPLIFLPRRLAKTHEVRLARVLCHVGQPQPGMVRVALPSLGEVYEHNRHEIEARYAAAATRERA